MNVATIMTNRLILKEIKLEDATILLSKIYTKENTKYLYQYNNPNLEEMIVHVGEINAEYKKLFPKMIVFAITNNDELIGIIKLTKVKHEFNTFEICWIIDPQYQRMGFAYEAAVAVIDYARKHKAKKITAHADIKNIPSIGLIEKLGFVRDGEVNQRIYPNQEKSFELTYALDL